jgi:hypothetical protein
MLPTGLKEMPEAQRRARRVDFRQLAPCKLRRASLGFRLSYDTNCQIKFLTTVPNALWT